MIFHRHTNNRKGQTLIEVLVALLVFIVGILAVVRMFPGGFTALQQGENVATAGRLAQAELDRLQSMAQNLPAGIFPVSDTFEDDPANPDVAANFRRVEGECTVIPAPADNNESIYMVGFGPVDSSMPIKVYSAPMIRVAYPTDGNTPNAESYKNNEYSIDYASGILWLLPQPYDRSYRATYSYWMQKDSDIKAVAVVGSEFTVPAGTESIHLLGSTPSGFKGIVVGSDRICRSFEQLGQAYPWSSDPYQFKLIDANMGIIYFNPKGYGYKDGGSWSRPFSAYIDYTILDLQIIREDRKVPDGATSSADARLSVKLSLPRIKEKGVTAEFNNTIYAGIGTADTLRHSVIAIDAGTGIQYNDTSTIAINEYTHEKAFTVDYKNGVLKFNSEFSGHTFRIFYRAEGDWMVQISKPYSVFTPAEDLNNMDTYPLLYNSYYAATNHDSPMRGTIMFSRCYSGNSVAVDYTYQVNGKEYSVTGDVFVISKETGIEALNSKTVFINIAFGGAGRLYQIWGKDADIQNLKISRVYGASAGVRVMWRSGGRGPFAGRWKTADLQTYLPRPGK
jgi:type II secretory pathway pseudopilin PulG